MIGSAHAKRIAASLEALRKAKGSSAQLAAARKTREAADKLEAACVEAARDDGLTWAEIGKIYGLSKQGAQQRFRSKRK
jgi:DNA-binding FadR family transcriptional regulator